MIICVEVMHFFCVTFHSQPPPSSCACHPRVGTSIRTRMSPDAPVRLPQAADPSAEGFGAAFAVAATAAGARVVTAGAVVAAASLAMPRQPAAESAARNAPAIVAVTLGVLVMPVRRAPGPRGCLP